MLRLAAGVIGGALVGAAIGAALIGLVILAWPNLEASGWVFLLLTVWFAVGGSVLGCFFAISRAIGFSESWPLTFEDETDGPVWLAVYDEVDRPEELAAPRTCSRSCAIRTSTFPARRHREAADRSRPAPWNRWRASRTV